MTDKRTQAQSADPGHGNMEKDPADWVTGDEPMTGAQMSYLKTLSEEAHVDFDETLSKAAASRRIDELQHMTGRGLKTGAQNTTASSPRGPASESDRADDGGDEPRMSIGPS